MNTRDRDGRAVREAVKRINADKAKHLHYFIDYHAQKDADIRLLGPSHLGDGPSPDRGRDLDGATALGVELVGALRQVPEHE